MSDPADIAAPTAPSAAAAGAAPPGDKPKDSEEVLSKAGFGMGSGVIQIGIRAVTTVLTGRALHAELLGLFHLSNRLAKVGSTFSMSGQDDAIVHFVARYRATGELGKARGAFNISFLFAAGLSVVMGALVYFFADWAARNQFPDQPVDRLVPIIQTFAIAVPLSALGGVLGAALQGSRQIKKTLATQNLIIPGARLILFAILLCFGLKLFGLVFALLGSFFIGLFFTGWHVKNRVDWMKEDVVPVYETKKVILFSLPLIFLSLIDYANANVDFWLLGKYATAADIGVYGQALRIFTILKIPISALSALFIPLCAEFYAKKEMDRLRAMFRATASCGIRIAILAFGGTMLLAKPVMAVSGPDFVCGAATLGIMSTMLVSNCLAQLGGYAVFMSGRSWLVTLNQVFLTIICIGVGWPMTKYFGMEGAAIGRAVGWAAWATLILFETRKIFGFQPFSSDMLKGLLAGVLSFSVCWGLQQIEFVHDHMVLVILTGVLFTALYGWLCFLFGLAEDEKAILQKLSKKLAKKFGAKPKAA